MKQRYIQLLLRNVTFLHVTPELQGPSSLPHGPKKPRKLRCSAEKGKTKTETGGFAARRDRGRLVEL